MELLIRADERNIANLDKAIAAVEKVRAASDAEDEAFARWLKFARDPVTRKRLVHGNTVKAAERKHNNAHHAAIDVVFNLHVDERIDYVSVDVESDEMIETLKTVRGEIVEHLNQLLNPKEATHDVGNN